MSKIAVLLTNDFEDSEYSKPADAFKKAGKELIHVGLKSGEIVKGKKHAAQARIDKAFGEVSASDFDAMFIPGGYSPDQLRGHDEAVNFVRQFAASGKPILAICHGPQLLITADVLKGRTLTGWKSIAQDIKNAGAKFTDQEVVVDGNLVTSRKPDDIPAFIGKSLEVLSMAHV